MSPPLSSDDTDRADAEATAFQVLDHVIYELESSGLAELPEEERRAALRPMLHRYFDGDDPAPEALREAIVTILLDEILGLGPLEPLLRDPEVSDVLVNGPHEIYVERGGRLERVAARFRDTAHLMRTVDRIVSRVGRRVDFRSPMVDARLADGSRVNVVLPPLILNGPTLSIRRRRCRELTLEDLVRAETLSADMALLLEAAVKARLNVVVSGGTGSGKTTLLNALSRFIPDDERIITIEDAAELRLQQRHVLTMETRPPNVEGKGEVTARDLFRNALRMRPDRILIGECRGPEALDMLQAMNSGHEGSLTTLHANSPPDALTRLETMILMAGFDLPLRAVRRQVVAAIQLVVQVERLPSGARKVMAVTNVAGMDGEYPALQDLFRFEAGEDGGGGRFVATGARPSFAPRLRSALLRLPPELFGGRRE
jgi:pilus assembly protein CpaF